MQRFLSCFWHNHLEREVKSCVAAVGGVAGQQENIGSRSSFNGSGIIGFHSELIWALSLSCSWETGVKIDAGVIRFKSLAAILPPSERQLSLHTNQLRWEGKRMCASVERERERKSKQEEKVGYGRVGLMKHLPGCSGYFPDAPVCRGWKEWWDMWSWLCASFRCSLFTQG